MSEGRMPRLFCRKFCSTLVPFSSIPALSTEGWEWCHKRTQSHFSLPLLTNPMPFFSFLFLQVVIHLGFLVFRGIWNHEDITHKLWSGSRLLSQINMSEQLNKFDPVWFLPGHVIPLQVGFLRGKVKIIMAVYRVWINDQIISKYLSPSMWSIDDVFGQIASQICHDLSTDLVQGGLEDVTEFKRISSSRMDTPVLEWEPGQGATVLTMIIFGDVVWGL